jgi:hypothetical protein
MSKWRDRVREAVVCAICCDLPEDSVMTLCGHTFCRKCVAECLNLKHVCPICNQPCTLADVRPNLTVQDACVFVSFFAKH